MAVISNLSDTTGLVGSASMPDGSPLNYDLLPNNKFRLIIPGLEMVEFFLQDFVLPDIVVHQVNLDSRYVTVNEIGEKCVFGNFTVRFMIDKGFRNWSSIFAWQKRMTSQGSKVGESRSVVLLLDNVETFRFAGSWPTRLGGFSLSTTESGVSYLTAECEFNVDYFDLIGPNQTVDTVYN